MRRAFRARGVQPCNARGLLDERSLPEGERQRTHRHQSRLRSGPIRSKAVIGFVAAVVISGCGGGMHSTKPLGTRGRSVDTLKIDIPSQVRGAERGRAVAGRTVAADAGCLACHVIGTQGNSGPGPNLTHVGSQLSTAALILVLREPRPPMPSFAHLPRSQFMDLVTFLHSLR